ncbi:hypothetical protein [Bradyrhizobium sp. S3.9.1]|uniref:hypothetical protein n=1 Tax=Bradyrhizobium sp. S3.9.1 TaxID=3156431 RepID=UPI00339522B8
MDMTTTSEAQGLVEQLDPAALALAVAALEPAAPEASAPAKRSSRKSVLALSVCALAINGAAAIYTLPADFPSPNVSSLAELLPRREASAPKPDPVVAALKDIQSAQQQHTASLQENNHALQQNAALLQQDLSLRQSITDERVDVRKISSQLSTLIAKVDTLQNAMMSDVTSSIRKANARYGLSAAMRKRMVRQSKSVGPVSVGGAPLSVPAATSAPES